MSRRRGSSSGGLRVKASGFVVAVMFQGSVTFSNIPKMAMGLGVGLHLMHPSDPKNVPRTDSS